MADDQMELPGTCPRPSPLFVAIEFNDTVDDEKVRVGRLLINERGLAIVVNDTGRETLEAHVGVLRMCEEMRKGSIDGTEGERALTALTHALVRLLTERFIAERDDP